MNLDCGQPRAITQEGFRLRGAALSPDGKLIATIGADGLYLLPSDGGDPQLIHGSGPGDLPLHWENNNQILLVGSRGETSCPVVRLDLKTAIRTPWKSFSPADTAGVVGLVVSFAERRRTALCFRIHPQPIGPILGGTLEVAGAGRPMLRNIKPWALHPPLPAGQRTTAFLPNFLPIDPHPPDML